MASAAPPSSRPFSARARALSGYLAKLFDGFGPIFLGAVLAGLFTYGVTSKLNRDASLQQQELAALSDFSATGAKVDAAITQLMDNAYDKVEIGDAKKEARQALAGHAASTLGLMPVLGKGNVEAYMQGVAELRILVDRAGDLPATKQASRGRFALIDNRIAMIAEARRRIYS